MKEINGALPFPKQIWGNFGGALDFNQKECFKLYPFD